MTSLDFLFCEVKIDNTTEKKEDVMLKIPVTFESFTLYFGKLCFPSVLYRATANGSDTVLGAHLFLPPALVALCLFPLPIIATTIAGIHQMFVWVPAREKSQQGKMRRFELDCRSA